MQLRNDLKVTFGLRILGPSELGTSKHSAGPGTDHPPRCPSPGCPVGPRVRACGRPSCQGLNRPELWGAHPSGESCLGGEGRGPCNTLITDVVNTVKNLKRTYTFTHKIPYSHNKFTRKKFNWEKKKDRVITTQKSHYGTRPSQVTLR